MTKSDSFKYKTDDGWIVYFPKIGYWIENTAIHFLTSPNFVLDKDHAWQQQETY